MQETRIGAGSKKPANCRGGCASRLKSEAPGTSASTKFRQQGAHRDIAFQSQRIADHGHAAQRHGGARKDGTEQNAEKRIKNTRRNRNSKRVVKKREEQVLPDISHRGAAQGDGLNDPSQIALHERDAGTLHRNVCSRSHGNSNVRRGEGGSVVDSVASHRHNLSSALQLQDLRLFVGRIDLRNNIVNPKLPGQPGGLFPYCRR